MDTSRIRRELVASCRLAVTEERRLLGGAALAVLAYAVWVGATGAALNYAAEFAGRPISVVEWSATTTVALGVAALLWVLVPAAVVTRLVDRALTNASGNVRQHYRLQHPFLLVVPLLLLFAAGAAAPVALGEAAAALLAALAAVGLFALVRTVAVSYRVFSFGRPIVAKAFLFVALTTTAVAALAGAATVAGREAFVAAAATGIADRIGVSAAETFLTGSVGVGDASVPYLLGTAAALPVVLTLLYLAVQSAAAVRNRTRRPDVPRSKLRTGQRYPEFAKPVSATSASDQSTSASGVNRSASANAPTDGDASGAAATAATSATAPEATSDPGDATADDGEADGAEANEGEAKDREADDAKADNGGRSRDESGDAVSDPGHTKVFTPPADGDIESADSATASEDAASQATADPADGETAVVTSEGGSDEGGEADGSGGDDGGDDDGGYRCPSCGDRFDADASFVFCPNCGSELEAT